MGVNDQIAFKDVLAPVRFFTPFPRQPSRPCGTPRVYQGSRPEIPCSYVAPPYVYYRAHTVLGPDSVVFPQGKHRCGETMFGGSKEAWHLLGSSTWSNTISSFHLYQLLIISSKKSLKKINDVTGRLTAMCVIFMGKANQYIPISFCIPTTLCSHFLFLGGSRCDCSWLLHQWAVIILHPIFHNFLNLFSLRKIHQN